MIDFFDWLYSMIVFKNKFLIKIRFYSILRFAIRLIANILIPIYFIISQGCKRYSISTSDKRNERIIVSLTSFPGRIGRVWLVIETILHQTQKPDKIILWLSKEQFPSLLTIPKKLLKLQKRGLEIRLCEGDLRSHKKYFYVIQEFPDDLVITVDDDIFYCKGMIENLIMLNIKYPKSIIASYAYKIKIVNSEIRPYGEWQILNSFNSPSFNIFFGSGGGTLFPSKSLYSEVLNKTIFLEFCLYADDVWLNVMCRLNGFSVVKTDYHTALLPIMNYKNTTLNSLNVIKGLNDIQILAVRDYCIKYLFKDPFEKSLM